MGTELILYPLGRKEKDSTTLYSLNEWSIESDQHSSLSQ